VALPCFAVGFSGCPGMPRDALGCHGALRQHHSLPGWSRHARERGLVVVSLAKCRPHGPATTDASSASS
jgi:hypothetical protein